MNFVKKVESLHEIVCCVKLQELYDGLVVTQVTRDGTDEKQVFYSGRTTHVWKPRELLCVKVQLVRLERVNSSGGRILKKVIDWHHACSGFDIEAYFGLEFYHWGHKKQMRLLIDQGLGVQGTLWLKVSWDSDSRSQMLLLWAVIHDHQGAPWNSLDGTFVFSNEKVVKEQILEELYSLQIEVKKDVHMLSLVKSKVAQVDSRITGFKNSVVSSGFDWETHIKWVEVYFGEKQCQENATLIGSATIKLI